MNTRRVSVVVPVFEVIQWLDRCVASIQEQTYPELEIILIDDGSTDGSGPRIDELAAGDERIIAIHQTNRGLSAARNRGLEIASGEWITFIDSDDWIHPQMIERMMAMVCRDVDIAIVGYKRVTTSDLPESPSLRPSELLTTTEVLSRYFGPDRTLLTIACAKLFRRHLFRGISFPEGRYHEDEATTYKLLAQAEKVSLNRAQLYYYFSNPNSITGSGLSPRHHEDIVQAAAERQEFFQEHGPSELYIASKIDLVRKLIQLHESYISAGEPELARDVLERIQSISSRIPLMPRPLAALFVRIYPIAPTLLGRLRRARLGVLRAMSTKRRNPRMWREPSGKR